jgi:GNAT superfamily N-acetyltransferase
MTEPGPLGYLSILSPPTRPVRNSRDLWMLSKQIDELGGEWTFPIFNKRAFNFHYGVKQPQFYEPISDFERLALEAFLIQKANAYCPSPQPGDLGVSLKVYRSIFDAEDGMIRMPKDGETVIGQHYMAVIGIKDADTLILRNSWLGWTADGIGYLSREYFEHCAEEGMLSRLWNYGPNENTADPLLRCDNANEFARLWKRTNRYGIDNAVPARPGVRLKWYGCWSLQDEASAEILMIELDRQVPIGVAIIVHHKDSTSELSDLFIWPSYRRIGYGLLLERFAARRATIAGSSNLGVYFWNSDAIKGKDRALNFLRSAKYLNIDEFDNKQCVFHATRPILFSAKDSGRNVPTQRPTCKPTHTLQQLPLTLKRQRSRRSCTRSE